MKINNYKMRQYFKCDLFTSLVNLTITDERGYLWICSLSDHRMES